MELNQFRNLGAKAGMDNGDIIQGRHQLGHTTIVTTEK